MGKRSKPSSPVSPQEVATESQQATSPTTQGKSKKTRSPVATENVPPTVEMQQSPVKENESTMKKSTKSKSQTQNAPKPNGKPTTNTPRAQRDTPPHNDAENGKRAPRPQRGASATELEERLRNSPGAYSNSGHPLGASPQYPHLRSHANNSPHFAQQFPNPFMFDWPFWLHQIYPSNLPNYYNYNRGPTFYNHDPSTNAKHASDEQSHYTPPPREEESPSREFDRGYWESKTRPADDDLWKLGANGHGVYVPICTTCHRQLDTVEIRFNWPGQDAAEKKPYLCTLCYPQKHHGEPFPGHPPVPEWAVNAPLVLPGSKDLKPHEEVLLGLAHVHRDAIVKQLAGYVSPLDLQAYVFCVNVGKDGKLAQPRQDEHGPVETKLPMALRWRFLEQRATDRGTKERDENKEKTESLLILWQELDALINRDPGLLVAIRDVNSSEAILCFVRGGKA